ncbi:MAG: DUF4209 domain-containing protein [Gammaproteobacteria bacterium]
MLGQGSGNRLKEMEIQIVSALEQAAPDDGFLALWLADLLDQTRLGRSKRKEVACKLGSLASSFDVAGDLHRSRQYFAAAAKWHEYAGDEVNAASMIAGLAEGWVKEAMARTAGASPSHMVAATFLQNAIHAYRRIPSRRRPDNRVDERLATLHRMMLDAGEKSLSEMGVIQSPPIDVTELVNNARKAVAGKPLKEALIAFADIYHGVRYQKLRASAMELLGEHPLQALFPATVLSRDGRVIARQPGISLAGTGSPDDGAAIWANTVKDYGIQLGIVVQGVIWPALETLTLEHRLREVELIAVASQSPVVPPGREHFVGKALFAGFERDFVTSIHLLVPQVEHMVRWHLKSRLIKTTSLDANGIENEVGLSALLEKSEVCEIFGEDLMFELKAVFADPFGPNLRNEVAHGLLEHDQAQSIYSIYAWWWYFRLVFKRFVIEVGKKQQAPATGPKPEDTEKKE